MDDLQFEWDDAKDRANRAKHGISFDIAARVFADPLMRLVPDGIVAGEERWRAFGQVGGQAIVMVAHAYRARQGHEVIRIISARMATRADW